MADKEKPLPRPPRSGFGPKDRLEPNAHSTPLSADKMTGAMAEGKFEEYLAEKFQDNEQAKELARMMMGLSGMGGLAGSVAASQEREAASAVPPEIADAAASGDLKGLVDLLASEQQRRSGESEPMADSPADGNPSKSENSAPPDDEAYLDRATLDQLIRIASENNVTVDWVMARAVKLYVRDYKLTGRI